MRRGCQRSGWEATRHCRACGSELKNVICVTELTSWSFSGECGFNGEATVCYQLNEDWECYFKGFPRS